MFTQQTQMGDYKKQEKKNQQCLHTQKYIEGNGQQTSQAINARGVEQ